MTQQNQRPSAVRETTDRQLPSRRPRIGILGVMQELYDDMIPGITDRQGQFAADVAEQLSDVGEFLAVEPARNRADAERLMARFEAANVDGVMIVMLTYGPAMRLARVLGGSRVPLCLANIQPEPAPTAQWEMADMTYNQGVHGAQDTANAMVRSGVPFDVVTGDWRSDEFKQEIERWAHAAAAVTAMRSMRVANFGYGMNGMGDIRVDENVLLRVLGPEVAAVAPGDLVREMAAVGAGQIGEVIAFEDATFEIDPRLSSDEREDHVRMQIAIETILRDGGFSAYSTHFDAIGEDGRFRRLPFAAASSLMAKGYGFAGEGDMLTAALVAVGHVLIGDAHFTEMYAMDFPGDSILMSHMGEGNWKVARQDERVRLIKRPIGIAKLEDPPTFLFRYEPGPATIATLFSPQPDRFRLVVSEGEVLDAPELPALEMPYGQFRPDAGVAACLDRWLGAGGTHHQVMNLGRHAGSWRTFCRIAGIEYVEV
jgi:L-arabinose isomerase